MNNLTLKWFSTTVLQLEIKLAGEYPNLDTEITLKSKRRLKRLYEVCSFALEFILVFANHDITK